MIIVVLVIMEMYDCFVGFISIGKHVIRAFLMNSSTMKMCDVGSQKASGTGTLNIISLKFAAFTGCSNAVRSYFATRRVPCGAEIFGTSNATVRDGI